MAFKHKYSFEEKVKILQEYHTGVHGFRELCRIYGMAQQALKDWIRLYETFGTEGLKPTLPLRITLKKQKRQLLKII